MTNTLFSSDFLNSPSAFIYYYYEAHLTAINVNAFEICLSSSIERQFLRCRLKDGWSIMNRNLTRFRNICLEVLDYRDNWVS